MFDSGPDGCAALAALVSALPLVDLDVDDAIRVDQLRLAEHAKSALAAFQARVAARLAASQRAKQRAVGVPDDRADRGIANQVALALKTSPWRARRFLGWASILTTELPQTFTALQRGQTTEHRAMTVARETIWLSRSNRARVDAELAGRLGALGDRRTEIEARKLAYRLEPETFVARARSAAGDRRVTLRPAPDAMTYLTALLPVAQGVACYAALRRVADSGTAAGDGRGRNQLMADALVERVTGQAQADAVPVEINLVMTDRALFSPSAPGSAEPALVDASIPVPADIARALVLNGPAGAPRWLRRLYVSPDDGQLVAMDSRRRTFTSAQQRFLRVRDAGLCRTPWCEAPARHADHVQPSELGGPTRIDNAQSYCASCNYAKQAPGWSMRVESRAGPHEVVLTTPTGHRYRSRAPDPLRAA